jgi:hypothetical protein
MRRLRCYGPDPKGVFIVHVLGKGVGKTENALNKTFLLPHVRHVKVSHHSVSHRKKSIVTRSHVGLY